MRADRSGGASYFKPPSGVLTAVLVLLAPVAFESRPPQHEGLAGFAIQRPSLLASQLWVETRCAWALLESTLGRAAGSRQGDVVVRLQKRQEKQSPSLTRRSGKSEEGQGRASEHYS